MAFTSNNKYLLPVFLSPVSIVVDIGMEGGSFTKECLDRGVGMVYGFDAQQKMVELATENLKEYADKVKLYHQAVVRSDEDNYQYLYNGYPVDAVRFDFIISHLERVDILRLNCRGNEYPILYTTNYLDRINSIIVDFTELKGLQNASKTASALRVGTLNHFKIKDLQTFLETKGFKTKVKRNNPLSKRGILWAYRPQGFPFFI